MLKALALSPPINHSWGVALDVRPRGLSTHLLPHGERAFTLAFDFVEHQLVLQICDGAAESLPLENQSVAEFFQRTLVPIEAL